jgi:ribosomal-protein-alanine N-acetyltransferase
VGFHLREYRKEDFERLWAIDQACFPPGISYSRSELVSYIKRRNAFTIVAECAGDPWGREAPNSELPETVEVHVSKSAKRQAPHEPVGTAGSSKSANRGTPVAGVVGFIVAEAGRQAGHIITIDIVKEARGTGLGSRLMALAEERLRQARCRAVYLEAAVDNRAALAFYKRHGYFLLKTIPRYYSNGVDAFVLKKDLLPGAIPG